MGKEVPRDEVGLTVLASTATACWCEGGAPGQPARTSESRVRGFLLCWDETPWRWANTCRRSEESWCLLSSAAEQSVKTPSWTAVL